MIKKDNTIRWMYFCSKKYLWMVILLSLLSMGISGSFILIAVVSKQILDIATGNVSGNVLEVCLYLVIIILAQAIMNIISSNCKVRSQAKIENNIKQHLLLVLFEKEYPDILKLHSGEIMNRFTSDVEIVASGVVGFIPQILSLFTKLIAGIIVMFAIDKNFTLVILIIGAIVIICSRLYSCKFRYLHKEVQRTNGEVRSFMQECIENVVVIKSFVNEKYIKKQLENKQDTNYKIKIKQNMISNIANTSIYVVMSSGYYIALGWGAIQISKGLLTFGTLTAFLQILNQIRAPIKSVSGIVPRYDSMIASAQRLIEIEKLKDEKKFHQIDDMKAFYQQLEGISIEHGSFSYGDKKILDDISIFISKGKVIAITGESGNGKTTLFNLLLGLLSLDNGNLLINKKNNEKILIDGGTRKLFSYVPQGNMILSGTIKENILFGKQDATDAQLEEVIKIACLEEVIKKLPQGINTVLKERGVGLSEGQRQRIAVARAIISDAPILLLDECTSALDLETEKNLLNNLKHFKQKTVLCISHRSAAIGCCDLEICVENGKINYKYYE